MTNKEYHAKTDYYGSTVFKMAYASMLKYSEFLRTGFKKDTKDLKFGRIYHKVIGEESKFSEEFSILDYSRRTEPDKTMGSNANKEWEKIMLLGAEKRGVEICSIDDYAKAKAMKEALRLYRKTNGSGAEFNVIDSLLSGGEIERSYFCDDYLGLKVKCRPDLANDYMTVDWKSIAGASPEEVKKAVIKWGWDIQIALYSDLRAMFLEELAEVPDSILVPFYIMAQEKKEPYDFCFYNVSEFYSIGKVKLLKAIDKIKSANDSGLWGLIPQNDLAINLTPPAWAYYGLDLKPDELGAPKDNYEKSSHGEFEDFDDEDDEDNDFEN
jgi:hypothetical protein